MRLFAELAFRTTTTVPSWTRESTVKIKHFPCQTRICIYEERLRRSLSPFWGLFLFRLQQPTADAVGFILSPLRGWLEFG
jgi:hypothetical protein